MNEKIEQLIAYKDFAAARRMLKKHKSEFSEFEVAKISAKIEREKMIYLLQKRKPITGTYKIFLNIINALILTLLVISLIGTVVFTFLSFGPKHMSWDGFVETNFPPRRQKALAMHSVFFGAFISLLGIYPIPDPKEWFCIILGIISILSGLWQLSSLL